MRSASDRSLVEAFLHQRSAQSFHRLYARHTPRLFMLALRLTGGNRGQAEEILQEAWVRAIERLPAFAWRSALRTWLIGIVINCAREDRRRRGHGEGEPERERSAAPPAAGGRNQGIDRIDLERAIARLTPGYRRVLLLHDVEQFTHVEIGQILGIDPGTSKSQLSRARRALRAALGQEWRPLP